MEDQISDLKVDFLKKLILESPSTSLLKIVGFYLEFISEDSFQRIFKFENISDRKNISKYIIPLSEDLKEIVLEVLEKEKTNLVYEMTHFCIEFESELIFISYDSMDVLEINISKYTNISKSLDEKYNTLKISKSTSITDNGFFGDIKMPASKNNF